MTDDDIFTPSEDIQNKYKEQLTTVLETKGAKSDLIDMGRLPEVYTVLGIADKQLKTNGKAIRKMLGLEGQNRHRVPIETAESLLSLTYNPEAVFKSLSGSQNPNAYIAVLNAKTKNHEQIIAILSPSLDGQGYTFIPSVYEKRNFDRFLKKTNDEQKILYIKSKGSEIWGQLQLPPRHTSEPYPINILTKDDVVKRILTKKEQNMSGHGWGRSQQGMERRAQADSKTLIDKSVERIIRTNTKSDLRKLDNSISIEDASNYIDLYSSTFGYEGLSYLDKKINSLIKEKKYYSEPFLADKNAHIELKEINKEIFSLTKTFEILQKHQKEPNSVSNSIIEHEKDIIAAHSTSDETNAFWEELSSMPKQGELPAHRADKNFIDKENRMSDELEPEKPRDPKEEAFLNAVHQRKVIADAVKAGTLSCLPGADGYADTSPASNLVNGTNYHGANLLFLKDHQKQNGFPSAEYVTSAQLDKAKQDNPDLFIRKGEHGISLYVSEKIEGTADKYEEKQIRLFNIAQTNRPDKLEKWAEQKREEDRQSYIEWGRKNYGSNWNPPEQKPKEPGPVEIACTSTDPAKYLGEYLAAVSMGSKFKASPEQAAEFSQKMTDALYAKLTNKETGEFVIGQKGQPVSDPFSLDKISREANLQCKEITRNIRMEAQKQDQPEMKQEQTQSRGRGM